MENPLAKVPLRLHNCAGMTVNWGGNRALDEGVSLWIPPGIIPNDQAVHHLRVCSEDNRTIYYVDDVQVLVAHGTGPAPYFYTGKPESET